MDCSGKHVLIIGAGVSGLSCAHHLKESGYVVTVIEGRDRIGGRVWTRPVGKAMVDCGASWVHGTKGNPVAQLASEIGLELYQTQEDFNRIQASVSHLNLEKSEWQAWDSSGKPLEQQLIPFEKAFSSLWEQLEETSVKLQRKSKPHIHSVLEFLNTTVNENGFRQRWEAKLGREIFAKAWNWAILEKESYYSTDLSNLSMKWLDDEKSQEEIGGNRHTINGYKVLVDHLAEGLNIELSQKVVAVTKKGDHVEVQTDKKSYTADLVVTTLPLGVLKKNEIKYEPHLSKQKQKAIEGLGFGFLNKVVLLFSQVFWCPTVGWLSYLSDEEASFTNIKSLFKKTGESILVFYLAPKMATLIQENGWSEEQVTKRCLGALKLRFGDLPEKYFKSGFFTSWQTDPFAWGSYSVLSVTSTGDMYDTMSEPEMDGKLLFAGEATERGSPATVQGAFVSGRREANRVKTILK